jgi:NAD(P)-dependent dehydrogenase (short-subunit alcohol dehydrogenase family)
VLFDVNAAGCAALQAELDALARPVATVVGDVVDPAACNDAVARTLDRFGRLDILVNNAGGGRRGWTHELSDADWRHVLSLNTDGTFYMTRAALRPMLDQGGGAIVNLCSIHGHTGFPHHAAYNAAKGAIANLTRSLAIEYAAHAIRVNAVCPGVIRTPLIEKNDEERMRALTALHPIGRIGEAIEVARAIAFLASDEASFITGANLMVDGGYTAQ